MEIKIIEADWSMHKHNLLSIRRNVFVKEQRVPVELEADEWDKKSRHVLLYATHQPIGTGRLLPDGHIGRIAVLKYFRGNGYGEKIVSRLVSMARNEGHSSVFLSAQVHAEIFYERQGFKRYGNVFYEAGIRHVAMRLILKPPTGKQFRR